MITGQKGVLSRKQARFQVVDVVSTMEHLKVMEQRVDTSSAAGRAFYGMLAVLAAFETDVRRER